MILLVDTINLMNYFLILVQVRTDYICSIYKGSQPSQYAWRLHLLRIFRTASVRAIPVEKIASAISVLEEGKSNLQILIHEDFTYTNISLLFFPK